MEEDPLLQEGRDKSALYFARSGRAMLEMQIYVEKENKSAAKWEKRALAAGNLLRRKVKVSEMEEGAGASSGAKEGSSSAGARGDGGLQAHQAL